jgi:hypothetical protein
MLEAIIKDDVQAWVDEISNAVSNYTGGAHKLHRTDIKLVMVNSKIKQMSKRRAKIALAKKPYTILNGCYPIHVSGESSDTVSVTFKYYELT